MDVFVPFHLLYGDGVERVAAEFAGTSKMGELPLVST
jgi:hypothetical protein